MSRAATVGLAALLMGGVLFTVWQFYPEPPAALTDTGADAKPRTMPADRAALKVPIEVREAIPPTPLDEAAPRGTPVEAPSTPPNVVVVIGCTVRRDQVTPYGGPPQTTPFLEELAQQGTVFDDPISAAPWTRPASVALLTGHHASSVGMVEPKAARNRRAVPESVTLLAERLSEAGYLTIGATANPNLEATFGFEQGFDHYQEGVRADWRPKPKGKDLVDTVLGTLDTARSDGDDRPFYLQTMLIDAHSPRDGNYRELAQHTGWGIPNKVAGYRAALRGFDDAVRHLYDALDDRELTDNTLFVVVSDHGEGLYWPRHHGKAHGQFHTPSTNHAIWLLAGPGVSEHHRILGVASQVDVVPTLLGLLNLPPGEDLPGIDMSALVRGDGYLTPRTAAWSDTWFVATRRSAVYTHDTSCQQDFGSGKRTKKAGRFLAGCFDRHEDPLFTTPQEAPELLAQLRAWHAEQKRKVQSHPFRLAEEDDDLDAQLEALGYRE